MQAEIIADQLCDQEPPARGLSCRECATMPRLSASLSASFQLGLKMS